MRLLPFLLLLSFWCQGILGQKKGKCKRPSGKDGQTYEKKCMIFTCKKKKWVQTAIKYDSNLGLRFSIHFLRENCCTKPGKIVSMNTTSDGCKQVNFSFQKGLKYIND